MRKCVSLVMCSVILVSSLSLIGCEKKDKESINNKEKIENVLLPMEKDNLFDLNLYFDSTTNENKPETAKEERLIKKEEVMGELIMQELIKGPAVKSQLKPILPKDTRLLSFSIKDNIAYVNLSKEAKTQMSAAKEKVCLESIIMSLNQISSITKVKIQIDSQDSDILGGNYDISKPLGKDDIQSARKK